MQVTDQEIQNTHALIGQIIKAFHKQGKKRKLDVQHPIIRAALVTHVANNLIRNGVTFTPPPQRNQADPMATISGKPN